MPGYTDFREMFKAEQLDMVIVARELADICGQSGIQLMVTLQRRFNPIYTSFLQLADQVGTPST